MRPRRRGTLRAFARTPNRQRPRAWRVADGIVEGLLPASGFVNGLDYPTAADLAVLVITKGCMPFQAAPTMAGCAPTPATYPKMFRVAEAAAAYAPVASYLAGSEHQTLKADPFGIMPPEYKPY